MSLFFYFVYLFHLKFIYLLNYLFYFSISYLFICLLFRGLIPLEGSPFGRFFNHGMLRAEGIS